MKKASIVVAGVLILLSGVIGYVTSNLGKSTGTIVFSKSDKPGLQTMKITGPYGWKCITYEKSKTSPDARELTITGKGIRDFPLFGGTEESTNYFPAEGKVENIPLEKDYLFYHPNDDFECYIVITKDRQRFERLK